MNAFIEWLESLNEKDTRARAVLRRSLAFDPGSFAAAYPYVEPFLKEEDNAWKREMFYLVAGLWAAHWREGRSGTPLSIGRSCAVYRDTNNSASTERRFVTLLDADSDQLPQRLRQMIAILTDQPIDFASLLKGLLFWNDYRKSTQNAWARDFYRYAEKETQRTTTTQEDGLK